MPAGTFYVFPNVDSICRRLGITSHGLAMYLLVGADDKRGGVSRRRVFREAGRGFLRSSVRGAGRPLEAAVAFLAEAVTRTDR